MSQSRQNRFLQGAMRTLYLQTAMPIIFVMAMNGLLTVCDAVFLGRYAGPDALAAVTLIFPAYMLVVALSTLVASGMSSLLARHLGAGQFSAACGVFASAHGLALAISACLMMLFLLFGRSAVMLAADGSENLAGQGFAYLQIIVLCSPLLFVLSINSDTLRNEGRAVMMAGMSLLVSLSNVVFNYLLIAQLNMGVQGSAYGTVLAQTLALFIIIWFRIRGNTEIRASVIVRHSLIKGWGGILALGAPQSLSFVGLALGSATIVMALQMVSDSYESTISAYGIITRIMTFAFLPLLGLSHAMQTITGNNFGAKAWGRSNESLRFGICAAFAYCAGIQLFLTLFASETGLLFVNDRAIVAEVARILPVMVMGFMLAGPLMMVSTYFQAIGKALPAAILGLAKPYLFAIPLTFTLADRWGEHGIWIAGPIGDLMLLILTITVLNYLARTRQLRYGLFSEKTVEASI